ncbi:MAG: hypothetical protein K2L22_06110 [Muribaculaceae bacterium]|nr:hypothetical protein [Muribaculaceae bacterium]
MTLDELSKELGKSVSSLANTLKQVGLSDGILAGNAHLTKPQEARLRQNKAKGRKAPQQWDEATLFPENSIGALARTLGRPLADMLNIVKMSRLAEIENLSPYTVLSSDVVSKIATKLQKPRIKVQKLAEELGVDPKNLAEDLCGKGIIPNANWHQKIDHETADKIRSVYNESSDCDKNDDDSEIEFEDEGEWEDDETEETASCSYNLSTLAIRLGLPYDRVNEALRYLWGEYGLDANSPVDDRVSEEIIRDVDSLDDSKCKERFEELCALPALSRWNDVKVEPVDTKYLKPGEIASGTVTGIDMERRTVKVSLQWYSWFSGTKTADGEVSFDEWGWDIFPGYPSDITIDKHEQFLILSHPDGGPIKLSKRLSPIPPAPKLSEEPAVLVKDFAEHNFRVYKTSSGAYGFLPYSQTIGIREDEMESCVVKVNKTFVSQLDGRELRYAEFRLAAESLQDANEWFIRHLTGISDISTRGVTKILDWEDFVDAYKNQKTILAEISNINTGGYLMSPVGNEDIELFCPYSKAPSWIDRSATPGLIGSEWLVKIESDPDEYGNTVVSAKLEPGDYDGMLLENRFYSALVCSYNDSGANLLVQNCVPVFLPNKYIWWKRGNDAKKDLRIGDTVIVKIINEGNRISASIRDASIDPWLRVAREYPVGCVLDTTPPTYIDKGFIRFDLGEYTGHLPASEISWTEGYIPDCREVTLPEPLRVVVTGYDEKSKTVQLSLRKLTPDPWENIDAHLSKDRIEIAVVKELTNNGVLLRVGESGFKGYLSYRDVDWCQDVDKNSFLNSVGDKINVKVTHINNDRRQLTCSLKALIPNPWEALTGKESVEGTIIEVSDSKAEARVRIEGGIECTCHESLDSDFEGRTLRFDILRLNVTAQQVVISYRKQEIAQLNTLAVGEMFKEYRNLTEADKGLIEESGDEEESEVYRNFIVKEVSSTGRVMAVYAEEDGEYENGILLPGAVTMNGYPVNVIFARQIVKQHVRPGEILEFKVTHRYEGFNYAVLAIDAAPLLELNDIATDDLASLSSTNGVEAMVLYDICTNRNLFVQHRGYFGYIPRIESTGNSSEIPETIRVKSVIAPEHPGQMIRFAPISNEDLKEELQGEKIEKELIEKLDRDLYDCYVEINGLSGFNPKLPDYYPFALQLRYNPEQQEELAELLASDPTYFSSQTFFLDCYKVKDGKGYILSIFNNNISISAYCREKEDGDEIRINEFTSDVSETSPRGKHYGKPLRIAGENVQIVGLNSSAMPPAQQDADLVMAFIKYNRDVLPELRRLSRDGLQKRGEHYLTLQELLKMDLKREEALCCKEVKIKGRIEEDAGSLGGYGIVFCAPPEAFESIMCKDDSGEGIVVMIKADDSEPFRDSQPSGVLKYLGSDRWIVELYANRDIDIAALNQSGLMVKRSPNTRHLKKQILAIDNFVYERNGLDIFSKIARNKLQPIEIPGAESIEANDRFNLQDSGDSQATALKMALGGSQISLIQGPPGTGKSTVIIDIIRNLVKRHKKVLVCTQSVAPIEELYFKLSGRKDGKLVNEPVKIAGYPLRCAYLRDDESIEISGSVVEQRNALKDMMLLVKKLNDINSSVNNTSIDELKVLKDSLSEHHKEECGEVARKFAKDILPQYSDVLDIMSEYHGALDKEDVENFASEHRTLNLEAVDVVFGTCIGVGVNPILRDLHFDTLIIDEAGKANYAESLVPMMMADEYVLVGDDKQLPPYTNSELVKELAIKRMRDKGLEMEEEGPNSQYLALEIEDIMEDVGKSLFGDLRPRLPESNQIMLSRQFRMHPMIGDFVSKLFYGGKVESVPKPTDRILNIKGLDNPIKFIDTSGMGSEARERRQGLSLYNDGEIQVIEEMLLPMLETAVDSGKSVGILSPYGAQVARMRERFPKFRKQIFTIDSIQGEEYDIVVFSFVRNTRSGSLNFVDDLRRLNVSFSRAKCNLIMIGHLDTLRNESLHKVDKEAVMAVYDEILNKKIELVVHHGAMQRMYDDFPPDSCPLIENLDDPYYVFEDCHSLGNGQFSTFYKGKLLSLYNPVLKGVPDDGLPEHFRASLIGYVDDKPHTRIEPLGLWLTSQNSLKNFLFEAKVKAVTSSGLTLELDDESLISLSILNSSRFSEGTAVEVEVKGNRKFTVKTKGNE